LTTKDRVAFAYGLVQARIRRPGYAGPDGITAARDAGVALADDFHIYSIHWDPSASTGTWTTSATAP
jgi:beta-glucanase (GH16 family)